VFDQSHWPLVFFVQYVKHYNPVNFFLSGFPGGLSVHPSGIGELFWLEGLFWIFAALGLWQLRYVARKVGFSVPILVVIWFVTFPIGSSMTTLDVPHEIRSYNFLPLPELLAGYGALITWEEISRVRLRWLSPRATAMAVIGV